MTRVARAARDTFRSLAVRNYRLFFGGQIVSVSGSWMQVVAQDWLVLQLTDSGVALGLVTAFQFVPMMILGPWAGVVADRVDKRRLLLGSQVVAAMLALTLGILTATGAVQLWMVFGLAFGLGLTTAFEMPARQAFVFEMVGSDKLTNAVSLNSIVMNGGRMVGPAIAGGLIAGLGLAACFLINAATYIATIGALAAMRTHELHAAPKAERAKGQLREGFRYVWSLPALRVPLLLVAVIGTLSYEFQVSLPLLARFTYDAGADGYGLLLSTMSVGAVLGGLLVAARFRPSHRHLGWAGLAFGVAVLLASAMPTLALTAAVMPLVGAASIVVITQANSTLQLTAAPDMRARVMALYGVAFLGSTPVGGPIVGWVGEQFGGRSTLVLGGLAAIVATLLAWRALHRAGDHPPAVSSPAVPAPRPDRQSPIQAEAAA